MHVAGIAIFVVLGTPIFLVISLLLLLSQVYLLLRLLLLCVATGNCALIIATIGSIFVVTNTIVVSVNSTFSTYTDAAINKESEQFFL